MKIQVNYKIPYQFNDNFLVGGDVPQEVLDKYLLRELKERVFDDILLKLVKIEEGEPNDDGTITYNASLQYDIEKRMVADKDEYGFTMVPKVIVSFYEPTEKQ